jgi:hypothetical protein
VFLSIAMRRIVVDPAPGSCPKPALRDRQVMAGWSRSVGCYRLCQPHSKSMSNEPKVYPEPQPDRGATVVRGVCGALLGLAVAVVIWMRSGGLGLWSSVALFAASVVVCALGSIRYGDSFWYGLLRRAK